MTEAFPGQMPESKDHADEGTSRALPTNSARYGAFTDAVVAIAMTLLILPLMESVSEVTQETTTVEFLAEHSGQLISFLISFVLVGMFWFIHHRIFRSDTPHSAPMSFVNFAWMLTIVFLPVATALTGSQMESDRPQIALYEGTLALSSWLLLGLCVLQLRVRRAADLLTPSRTILAAPLALSCLFTLVLLIGMIAPQLSYLPLFLMALTGIVRGLLVRWVHD